MITREQARAMRALIEQASESLTDEQAVEAPQMFPAWRVGVAYDIGDRRQHGGTLYTCVQAHTSQSDWTPDATPALWKVTTPEGTIPDWVQPTGAHDAYSKGDRVRHAGSVWESTVDANVWEPSVYGWVVVE